MSRLELEPALTVGEVAEYLAVHRKTVLRTPSEELPYFRIGKRGDRRYELADVMRYKRLRLVNGVGKTL